MTCDGGGPRPEAARNANPSADKGTDCAPPVASAAARIPRQRVSERQRRLTEQRRATRGLNELVGVDRMLAVDSNADMYGAARLDLDWWQREQTAPAPAGGR